MILVYFSLSFFLLLKCMYKCVVYCFFFIISMFYTFRKVPKTSIIKTFHAIFLMLKLRNYFSTTPPKRLFWMINNLKRSIHDLWHFNRFFRLFYSITIMVTIYFGMQNILIYSFNANIIMVLNKLHVISPYFPLIYQMDDK